MTKLNTFNFNDLQSDLYDSIYEVNSNINDIPLPIEVSTNDIKEFNNRVINPENFNKMINICSYLGIDAKKFVTEHSEPTFERYKVNNADINVMSVLILPDYMTKTIGSFNMIENIGKYGNLRWLKFAFENLEEYKSIINSRKYVKFGEYNKIKEDIFKTSYIKKNSNCLKFIIDIHKNNPKKLSYEEIYYIKGSNLINGFTFSPNGCILDQNGNVWNDICNDGIFPYQRIEKKRFITPELFNNDNLIEYILDNNLEFIKLALNNGFKFIFNVYNYACSLEVIKYFYEIKQIIPRETLEYNSGYPFGWDKQNMESYNTYIIGIMINNINIIEYAHYNNFPKPKQLYNLAYECGNIDAIIFLLKIGYTSNESVDEFNNGKYIYNTSFNNTLLRSKIKKYPENKLKCLKLIDDNNIYINYLNLIFHDIIYEPTDRVDILDYKNKWLQENLFSDETKSYLYLEEMNNLQSIAHSDNINIFKYFIENYKCINDEIKKKIIFDNETTLEIFKYMYDNHNITKDEEYINKIIEVGYSKQKNSKKKIKYVLSKVLV